MQRRASRSQTRTIANAGTMSICMFVLLSLTSLTTVCASTHQTLHHAGNGRASTFQPHIASALHILFPNLADTWPKRHFDLHNDGGDESTLMEQQTQQKASLYSGRSLLQASKHAKNAGSKSLEGAAEASEQEAETGLSEEKLNQDSSKTESREPHGLSGEQKQSEDTTSSTSDDDDPKFRIAALKTELKAKAEAVKRYRQKQRYLEKSLALKISQAKSRRGEAVLNDNELKISARMLDASKQEATETSARYTALLAKTAEMQGQKTRLVDKLAVSVNSKRDFEVKLQELTLEEIVEKHTIGLPGSMAGALRKSADALTPFFDTLLVAAETNQRLVDHVGSEIDKYTHVNIKQSPFLHGLLFYAVLMIPAMTVAAFLRRIMDSSSKLTASHIIIYGNLYFLATCILCTVEGLARRQDPAANLYKEHEKLSIAFNLFLAIYYMWHVCMLTLQAVYTRSRRDWAHVLSTTCIGIHYYLFSWQRIFTNSSPRMMTANYILYATIFCGIIYDRYNRIDGLWVLNNRFTRYVGKYMSHLSAISRLLPDCNLSAIFDKFKYFLLQLGGIQLSRRLGLRPSSAIRRSRSFEQEDNDMDSDTPKQKGYISDDVYRSRSRSSRRFVRGGEGINQNKSGIAAMLFGKRMETSEHEDTSDSDDDIESNESESGDGAPSSYFASLINSWRNGRDRVWPGWWTTSGKLPNQTKKPATKDPRRDQYGRSHSGSRLLNKRK
jgi:hypothetical protein